MRIGVISDLHLEFLKPDEIDMLLTNLYKQSKEVDLVVNAGDTHPQKSRRDSFSNYMNLAGHYLEVEGNHDYYGSEIENNLTNKNGIVSATLWTNFNGDPLTELYASKGITDFSVIKNFNTTTCKFLHSTQKMGIFNSDESIVVTHFAPSRLSIAPQYTNSTLNGYFCNNLDEEILNSNKTLWIHGHDHGCWDYYIGDCRVVANPLGYKNENETIENYKMKVIKI